MLIDTIRKKYEINELIAYDDFGKIYKVTDKKVKTEYILKELVKNKDESIKKTEKTLKKTDKIDFENEINFLKYVKGKNILNIIDYYEDDKDIFYYIVFEKMDGDLEKLMNEKYKNGMSSNLIRKIFSQINSGLKDMLKKGQCHRDLKPSNILYSYINEENTDFIIKLCDFGLSTDLQSTFQYASNVGTKIFKAPEVEKGKYSNKCDLYSIGIILYYLKTGECIFDGERELDILNNKDKNIIKKDTDDETLNKLIKKLVVKNPNERMEWKDYFNDPFFKVKDNKENNECKIKNINIDKVK
jgi:serine/threonine protein kinase